MPLHYHPTLTSLLAHRHTDHTLPHPPSRSPHPHTQPRQGEEKQNVSEMVVARGYATVIKHRTDEERSSVYER